MNKILAKQKALHSNPCVAHFVKKLLKKHEYNRIVCVHVLYLKGHLNISVLCTPNLITIRLFEWLCISFIIAISLVKNLSWWHVFETKRKWNKWFIFIDPIDAKKREKLAINKLFHFLNESRPEIKTKSASCSKCAASNEVPRNSAMTVLDRLINSQTDDLVRWIETTRVPSLFFISKHKKNYCSTDLPRNICELFKKEILRQNKM